MKLSKISRGVFLLSLLFSFGACSAENKSDESNLPAPAKSIFSHYVKIQTELSKDSTKGVDEHANEIAAAIKTDSKKSFPPEVAKQATEVAQAKDIKAAREAFKPLSESVMKYLEANKAEKGNYYEAYCPMAKAGWVQAGRAIKNPYMGKSMLSCGELKN